MEGYNYLGPGTRTDIRLDENLQPKPGEEPINATDAVALSHDIRYMQSNNLDDKHSADRIMLRELEAIQPATFKEKIARWIAYKIISIKIKLGLGLEGISEQELLGLGLVKEKQPIKHVSVPDRICSSHLRRITCASRKIYPRRRIYSNYMDEIHGMDLAEMKNENGYQLYSCDSGFVYQILLLCSSKTKDGSNG